MAREARGSKTSVSIRTIVLLAFVALCVAVAVVAYAGRTPAGPRADPPPATARSTPREPPAPRPAALDGPVTRVATDGDPGDGLRVVARSTTVVFASPADRLAAAHLALRLRAPLVVVRDAQNTPSASPAPEAPASEAPASGAADQARRIGVTRAVVMGGGSAEAIARRSGATEIVRLRPPSRRAPRVRAIIRRAAGVRHPEPPAALAADAAAVRELLADRPPPAAPTGVAVLVRPRNTDALPLVLAARAVGHTIIPTTAHDLRADPRLIRRLARLTRDGRTPQLVLDGRTLAAIDPADIGRHAAVAATGTQLPGAGQLVIDPRHPAARRYIGLYGVPHSAALGALGEQPVPGSVTRARRLARTYGRVVRGDVTTLPCFEIIATVASASAGRDHDFSEELPPALLRTAVDAAGDAGVYVLLDIQPGRTDFLSQAKRYRGLLRRPHVGLALDPEWRLRPGQRHLEQIGAVGIGEVNAVVTWLADLVDDHHLPQKMLLLHQFRLSMLRDRARLDTSRDALSYVIQMDGQGPQDTKLETWRSVTAAAPERVHFGWKNFYDEDTPLRSPADTMALEPTPVFVSYQ